MILIVYFQNFNINFYELALEEKRREYWDIEKFTKNVKLGDHQMGNEKFSAAIESFREALKRLPDGKDATSHRAACYTKQAESYLRLVNYSMCSQKCDLVIKMDEKEQIDQKNEPKGLGGFQYVFMKNWTTAIFFFEKTGRRNKNCWGHFFFR